MPTVEIVVGPERTPETTRGQGPSPTSRRGVEVGRGSAPAPLGRRSRDVLDVFIDGANVTARVVTGQAGCVLRDLALALSDLAHRPRGKALVRFYDEPWEVCVERRGARAALSVYRTGSEPTVAVYDRPVPWSDIVRGTVKALDSLVATPRAEGTLHLELLAAREALLAAHGAAPSTHSPPDDDEAPVPVALELDRDAPIAFASEFVLPSRASDTEGEPSVERADLHALLFRGRLRAEIRGRSVDLGEGHPFLFAEGLLDLARSALQAWEAGQTLHVRREAGGVLTGLRVTTGGDLALTLGAGGGPNRAVHTFPALGVADVLETALAFGRALVRALLRRDRAQGANLRLSAFRRDLRDAGDALREVCRQDVKVNPSPESYRAFARQAREEAGARDVGSVRLRYAARWRALVPGIDLRSTFLCGDRLVVGAARETFALARTSGEVLWRVPTEKATSVVTPAGIARVHGDGGVEVHDFGTGEVTLRARVTPRLGGPPAGAVVNLPGLPRLLILTEGERHLVALDLVRGEARWRFAWGNRGALRLKRAGKLLYFTSGDSALTALDVLTGSVVWRVRDRLRFRTSPTLDKDALYAVAGGVNGAATLHGVDAFSGEARWSRPLFEGRASCTVEGSPLVAENVVTVVARERHGLRLLAFRKETGEPLWASRTPVAQTGTSWLPVDDLLIGNSPTGEVLALHAETGEVRWRHGQPRVMEADLPRRLEPVLRSGALFVPFSDVTVFRPRDGVPIATIAPSEAIPDLLRVDERCDVYVAEESGHLVSFSAGPRLSLVGRP